MADWSDKNTPFGEPNETVNSEKETASAEQPREEQTDAVPSAPQESAPVPPPTYASWQTPPTPPTPHYYAPPTDFPPPHQEARPPQQSDEYRPQGGYHPYGYHAYPTPPEQKPPKKKRGTSLLIGSLCVICSACIVTLSVLLVLSLNGRLPSSSGRPAASALSGTAQSLPSNVQSGSSEAPKFTIEDATDENALSTMEIVERNNECTPFLTMYTYSQRNGYTKAGGASGIVWKENGYIITNAHCVYDEDSDSTFARIDVEMYDGTVYENATIIGYDVSTDLAVIKVDATGLKTATFGDSSDLRVGSRIITLGHPAGLKWTVTEGIVSGLNRDVYDDTGFSLKCLQIDAVINPGNSGGPLFNVYGQVVGINSAKIVMSGYEAIGFSIPINEAADIIESLAEHGYVSGRVSLGIMGQDITSYNYEGFQIYSFEDETAFAGTEAKVGDIITHIDGQRVMSRDELRVQLLKYEVGDSVQVSLLRIDNRSREVITFDVTIKLVEYRP